MHATGNIYKDLWGQQSAKEASNQQKLYTILLTCLAMGSSKIFLSRLCSLNGERVTCVCLQCGRRKQDCY